MLIRQVQQYNYTILSDPALTSKLEQEGKIPDTTFTLKLLLADEDFVKVAKTAGPDYAIKLTNAIKTFPDTWFHASGTFYDMHKACNSDNESLFMARLAGSLEDVFIDVNVFDSFTEKGTFRHKLSKDKIMNGVIELPYMDLNPRFAATRSRNYATALVKLYEQQIIFAGNKS